MSYVIVREEDGQYVAKLGVRAYTKKLQEARIWNTRAAAEVHKCGNEYIVDVREILK